jgi:hypothetical protein
MKYLLEFGLYDHVLPCDLADIVCCYMFDTSVILPNKLRYALSFTLVPLLLTTTNVYSFH